MKIQINLLGKIDKFLDSITMYRLAVYGLFVIACLSIVFGFAGILPFSGTNLLVSATVLVITCFLSSRVLSKVYGIPANSESWLITAFIVFLIITPYSSTPKLFVAVLIGAIAIASKYVFAINYKHIFNPAAFGALVIGLLGIGDVSWWVGSLILTPFVLILGLLIVRKLQRFKMFFSFVVASLVMILIFSFKNGTDVWGTLAQVFVSWPLFFLGTIMLTEPQTTPPGSRSQVVYGVIVGILFGSQFSFGPIYSSPELALIVGNIFAYFASPKTKLFLKLKEKTILAAGVYEFVFEPNRPLAFAPGQYLEWTLPHRRPDLRGNRRFFTIAASPTERELRIGVRIDKEKGSSFKKALMALSPNNHVAMTASGLAGSFTLPPDKNKKLVFIAGGIGVTPYRSIVRYLLDKKERRDIVLFYAAADPNAFAYKDLFAHAEKSIGLKVVYVLAGAKEIPYNWNGKIGYITANIVREEVPDFEERFFYLSGPPAMVSSYEKMLHEMGVRKSNIITDYFPGY